MKKLIYFIPFLCTFFSYSQIIVKNDSTVFKQCNAIEIATNNSAEELYKLCGYQLINDGFIIDNAIRDFYTINTKEFSGSFGRQFTMSITILENKIKIRGFLSSTESNLIPIVRYPNGNFNYLQKFALQIKEKVNGKMKYLQERYSFQEN